MRILHISTRLILGGSQENTVLSCERQALAGHEAHLAFGPIHGPEGSLLRRVEEFSGAHQTTPIHTHIVRNLVREIRPITDLRCVRELERLIQALSPDIVHTHSSKAGILGRIAASRVRSRARRRMGIVHTIHGPPFMPVTGGLAARARTRVTNAIYEALERHAAGRCDVIVGVADAMTRDFQQRRIGRPEQFVTVRSGMEIDRFLRAAPGQTREEARASLGIAAADVVIGTVARLAEHKGHDDLLDALGEDLRRNAHWRLLWVGDGWWRQRLEARARSLGLRVGMAGADGSHGASILLTGLVPPERVPMVMRAMDILAHPSTREGLPRTVPQALLAGVPAVAYDVDGTSEICEDGVTGRLIRAGDIAALGRAIRELAEDPGQRRALADRGRERSIAMFSVESMANDLERVYQRALRLSGGRA